MTAWGSEIEIERRNRILVAAYAYAYELEDDPLVSDDVFDELCKKINRRMGTGHPVMDAFFRYVFSPETGMWIHEHPELEKVRACVDKIRKRC